MGTQFLSVPGGTLAYDDQGRGPLVVCVPGMGDLRAEYRYLVPALVAAGYRVVTMDLRGQGESSVGWEDYSKGAIGGDVLALVRHLDAGPAVVLGTSYAAGAAVCAAAAEPERVAGVALVGAFVRQTGTPMSRAATRMLFGALFSPPWGVGMWARYYPTLFPSRKPEDWASYLPRVLSMLRERGRLGALRAMMLTSTADSDAALDRVRCLALVVMGTRDPDFKPSPEVEANEIARRVHGTVRMIKDAGHYPQAEFPEETARVLLPFLAECTAAVQVR